MLTQTDILAPTQTHILLRAPRRFTHPSWVPRQNLTRSLESTLHSFLEESSVPHSEDVLEQNTLKPKKKITRIGVPPEGVWIECETQCPNPPNSEQCLSEDEDDEMIWWAWDGKITGFSDW